MCDLIANSQRRVEASRAFLLSADEMYRLNSQGEFFYPDQHLKIDNTALSPERVAHQIVEHFMLPTNAGG